MNEEEARLLKLEIEDDRIREEMNIQKEEPMCIWISENLDGLKDEFIDDNKDAFDQFCREYYQDSL